MNPNRPTPSSPVKALLVAVAAIAASLSLTSVASAAANVPSVRPERLALTYTVVDADNDPYAGIYLRDDTRKAAEALHTLGVMTYCLTLDPDADAYVKRIFGANNYTIIDRVQRLPEKLPALFASLTS